MEASGHSASSGMVVVVVAVAVAVCNDEVVRLGCSAGVGGSVQCAVCGSGWKVWKGPAVEVAFACSETSGSGSGVYLR